MAKRTTVYDSKQEPKCKYILVYEGEMTEVQYFYGIIGSIEMIIKYIHDQQIVFDKLVDKVFLIIDRDKQSFTEEQYNYVVNTCNQNGFCLFVSNPCFELWLLLHSSNIVELSREELLVNKKPRLRAKKDI